MSNSSHSPLQNLPKNMKIRISTLILTMSIFQHFGELNATEPEEGSSTGERQWRGQRHRSVTPRIPRLVLERPQTTQADQHQFQFADPNDELDATEPEEGSSSVERRGRGRPKGSLTTRKPGQVLGRPRRRPTDSDQFRVADPNDELNATEPGEGSSTVERRKPGRPLGFSPTPQPGQALGRPKGSRTDQDQFRIADPNDGPPHRVVYYGQIEIKVWLDGPLVRKAIYPRNYIPQGKYYTYHNFLIRTLKRGDVTLVAYISQQETLTGVRAPYSKGHKYDLEPTSSVWYINYRSTHLKVDVVNSAPTGVSLVSGNVHVPAENTVDLETVAGIKFKLFREWRNFEITGAEFVSYDFNTA